jgi:hypothetical protein
MKGFKSRERAFEAKFARDNEHEFRVTMRATSIFARWVAEDKLGLSQKAADKYAAKILSLSVQDCSPSTLYRHIQKRLSRKKIVMSDNEMDAHFTRALSQARAELI